VRDGVHVASAGGTWMAMVLGLAGLRPVPKGPETWNAVSFRPRLPGRIHHIGFRIQVHGSVLEVDIRRDGVTYQVLEGGAVQVAQDGDRHQVAPGAPVTLPLPDAQG
jgi:alpha,alpha-trehalose phosphorylase